MSTCRAVCCIAVVSAALVLLMTPWMAGSPRAAELDRAAIEALLNDTADQVGKPLAEQGRGYSYYTYGTADLLYAVGDLDGDGRPEIAARAVYFLGVGSYDLVDIFTDDGGGYRRVNFLNLYNVGLLDQVEALEIRNGVLHVHTVGLERGTNIAKGGSFTWSADGGAVPASAPGPTTRRLAPSPQR